MAIDAEVMERLRDDLSRPDRIRSDAFSLLQEICRLVSTHEDEHDLQELVLRALEFRDDFGAARVVLDSLVRQVGLFPYLEPTGLLLRDQIA